jgi:flagellar biosynthesis protein FlhF
MIKKYKASTMRDAMEMAKNEFGDSAMVLKSRKVIEHGTEIVEITVTSENELSVLTKSSSDLQSTYVPAKTVKPETVPGRAGHPGPQNQTGQSMPTTAGGRTGSVSQAGQAARARPENHGGPVTPSGPETGETVAKPGGQDRQAGPQQQGKPFYTPADVRSVRNSSGEASSRDMIAELSEVKAHLNNMSHFLRSSKMILLPETLKHLTEDKGVEEELAAELVQKTYVQLEGLDVKDDGKIRNILRQEIARDFKTVNTLELRTGKPKMVCLVGPTGMGKTTSIIKLATHPDFYGNNKVGLITIDTYRVAAAAQLKTFAALAKIPLEIVYEPEHFSEALEKFTDREVILVDTAGRSPMNQGHLQDLKEFFSIVEPDEIHLVLSVSMHPEILMDAVKSFSELPVNRIIISKIDETIRLGNILNLGKKIDLPISFLTNGQRVPDDIHLADGCEIADLIVN